MGGQVAGNLAEEKAMLCKLEADADKLRTDIKTLQDRIDEINSTNAGLPVTEYLTIHANYIQPLEIQQEPLESELRSLTEQIQKLRFKITKVEAKQHKGKDYAH